MATGVYNRLNLAASTDTVVIANTAVASGKTSVVTVSICNRNASTVNIRLGISANTTLGVHEYLEYDTQLNSNGVLERTGIVIPNGLYLIARSSLANTSVLAYGIEG
jgi:hypothetical protein